MTAPLPAIAAKPPKRPASRDHLDPEARVECQVLHRPEVHRLDVIFIHGLYGSLGNTWRQGEWASKHQRPETVHLSRPSSLLRPCGCQECAKNNDSCPFKSQNEVNDRINRVNDRQNGVNDTMNLDSDRVNEDRKGIVVKENDSNDVAGPERAVRINEGDSFTNIEDKLYKDIKKILPEDDVFIAERFYDDSLLDQIEIVDNYETQAKFVSDLFKKSCDINCDDGSVNSFNDDEDIQKIMMNAVENDDKIVYDFDGNAAFVERNAFDDRNNDDRNAVNDDRNERNDKRTHSEMNCECQYNGRKQCEAGCGCICDDCYSPCWPRDWIKVDFPEARVISINYTSDPHLWRPLWIKENKRLRLHERAEQMTQQLLQLGVGERPVVWVGHSKGGLFIKQIYCEAYEAYLKTKQPPEQNLTEFKEENETNNLKDIEKRNKDDNKKHNPSESETNIFESIDTRHNDDQNKFEDKKTETNILKEIEKRNNDESTKNDKIKHDPSETQLNILDGTENRSNDDKNQNNDDQNKFNDSETEVLNKTETRNNDDKNKYNDSEVNNKELPSAGNKFMAYNDESWTNIRIDDEKSLTNKETTARLSTLWSCSAGFMFYSVPHRGAPLADIKTPITARSVELLEISKDCSLVLSLQERWLRATAGAPARPLVRSLVETRRTLMSVLWLRIVSAQSADPGIGALCGVSLDHREICKPSSRRCLLYTELAALIRNAFERVQSTELTGTEGHLNA